MIRTKETVFAKPCLLIATLAIFITAGLPAQDFVKHSQGHPETILDNLYAQGASGIEIPFASGNYYAQKDVPHDDIRIKKSDGWYSHPLYRHQKHPTCFRIINA